MRPGRNFLSAALLCASVLLGGGSAAAQTYWPPATVPERDVDPRWAAPEFPHRAPSEQAQRLEEALARYREIERRGGWNKVPADLAMGPGSFYDCASIAALERRLIAEGYLDHVSTPPPRPLPPPVRGKTPPRQPPPVSCEYGPALTAAMRAFQSDRKVLGYGQVGKLTTTQLNRPVQEIVNTLAHDVQRWRNVSLDPSGTYLLVNIPFFELRVYESGRVIMSMPVVVGQPTWPTPMFSDEIEHIIVNPEWGIPDSIAKKEIWPTARRDPGYFRREGIVATGDGLRQKPGPLNPLGRIKFMMPNHHNVYLHDTPGKRAFEAAMRGLSHGCIRLSKPIDLANYLLRDDPQWTPKRLQAAIASRRTQQINLRQRMPVHIIYATSRVNDEGRVEIRPDVYGLNSRPLHEEAELPLVRDDSLQAWP